MSVTPPRSKALFALSGPLLAAALASCGDPTENFNPTFVNDTAHAELVVYCRDHSCRKYEPDARGALEPGSSADAWTVEAGNSPTRLGLVAPNEGTVTACLSAPLDARLKRVLLSHFGSCR